uniref:Uncharacterized protein n=1 Tax=Aotus nancymaae TaxID=37293 RepID=A0A2K5DD61_AOTNA
MEGMDVDLDPGLMQKFSCLGTTDKDRLIIEFQRLLSFHLNPAGCTFLLGGMNNWNLQAEIGTYYNFESPNINVTIGEEESISPDTQFVKTWWIQNSDVIQVFLSVEVGGLLGVTQQLSTHSHIENNLKDPGSSEFNSTSKNTGTPATDQAEQDQNRLSQNSVNLSPSNHTNNSSVVTYSKVFHGSYPSLLFFGSSLDGSWVTLSSFEYLIDVVLLSFSIKSFCDQINVFF